jgi:hypothetical protein
MAANGYIGKISAVVTANTSDLSRKLNDATTNVTTFANKLSSSLRRSSDSATASIERIFTPLQQLERRLKTGLELNLRTGSEVAAIRAITQVAEQLNRPLEQAQKQFSALSLEAASGFAPALQRVQAAVVAVNNETAQTGRIAAQSFSAATAEVQRTVQAISRLTQAQQLAGQGLTGNELQFGNPRLFQTLQASARTTAAAGALPASALENGDIARQIRQLKQYENAAIEAQATVENLRLDPNVNPEVILAAERRLQQLTETARRAGAQLAATIEAASPAAAIVRANEQLALVADQPPPPPPRTDLGDGLAQAGRSRIEQLTGNVNIDSTPTPGVFNQQAQRDIDALATRVGAVRQQLETLPNSVRTRFIPELQRAQAQLVKLQNSPRATAKEIENAARRVDRLEASARRAQAALNFRKSFGGAGLRGIEEGLNQQALQGYNAQLQLLQQTLAGTSQAARGPAVAAFNNLRNAIAKAMKNGTLETEKTSRVIKRLTEQAVRLTAAAKGIGAAGLGARLKRVGDIGRGAFGNIGLGVQQAVFAFDDFFSVTGGLDQRLRAAGNNISQLGFVIGSTKGLIAGVAVSLGAQLVAALIKFSNANVGSEDRVKSLNDALSRQKSLVESLAQAYSSLADAILRSALSGRSQRQEEIRRQVDDIKKKQDEQAREQIAGLDPEVQRERGIQAARQRELEQTEAPARRVLLQRQIQEAARREREAADRAFNAPALSPVDAARRAVEAQRRVDEARLPVGEGGLGDAERQDAVRRQAEERRRAAEAAVGGAGNEAERFNRARAILRDQIEQLTVVAAERGPLFDRTDASIAAERELLQLVQVLSTLERGLVQATNSASATAAGQALRVGDTIGEAQQRIASIFEGRSSEIESVLDGFGRRVAVLTKEIENAQVAGDLGRVEAAGAEIEAIKQQADSLNIATQALDRFAEALNRASQEAQSNLQQAQQRADETRRQDLGRSTPATRQAREQADADLRRQQELASGVEQEVAAARERVGAEVARQAATSPADIVRRRREAEASFGEEAARLREAAAAGRALQELSDEVELLRDPDGRLPDEPFDRLKEASIRARGLARAAGIEERAGTFGFLIERDAGERLEDIEEALAATLAGLDAELQASGEGVVASFRRIAEIDAQLGSVGVLAPGRREELVRERAALEQQAVELDAEVRRARDESTREAEQAASAARGLDLLASPAERAANELNQNFADINAAFDRQQEAILDRTGGRPQDAQDELDELGRRRREAIDRSRDDAARAAAPAIFSLFDSVRNAVAAGPSRAALTASDISTSEGARELNRLIRGDDAARDVNLIELQEQTRLLRELVEKTDPAAVAN